MVSWISLLATAGLGAAQASTVDFDVQQAAANSQPLDKQLMGLSLEFGNTVDILGDVGQPNTFSLNLLQNIVDKSQTPTILRIGGNTQDRTEYCDGCPITLNPTLLNDPNDPKGTEALNLTYNEHLFDVLMDNVPTGTPIIFGLNFRHNSLSLAEAEISAAFDHMDQSRVMAYELGNEVNLYGSFRPSGYDVDDYGAQMREWLPSLQAQSSVDAQFQFPSFAGPPQWFQADLRVSVLVDRGVPQSIPSIEYISVHGYPYNICSASEAAKVKLENFLSHFKTRDLVAMYDDEIAAARSLGKIVHMGETGSVACHGKAGVSNTLGAALWELDYALTGATAGIRRFFFHMGHGDFYYSPWEAAPTDEHPAPYVNPTYFAHLLHADLLTSLTSPTIAPIPSLDTDTLVHFGIYSSGCLAKLVLLNTALTSTRPGPYVDFDVSPVLGQNLSVRRLTGPSSDATTGTSWAGQTTNAAGELVGELQVESVTNGTVRVWASEAVVVERA